MDKILEDNFKFTTQFFKNAIAKGRLFHSYLLTGTNTAAKYAFALNIAKLLNCEGDKTENCNCLNCKWIRDNAHPAVMTFSPLDYTHVNERSEAKTVITMEQARYIKDELSKKSTFHRVLIITDAIIGKEATHGFEALKTFNVKPPATINNEERIWAPKSLSRKTFSASCEVPNALLKTIEEPFDNITFFFIANSTEDLMPTIVSRCQVVNVPSSETRTYDFSIIEKIIKNYPAKDALTSIMLSDYVKDTAKANDLSVLEILNLIKSFYSENLSNYLKSSSQYKDALTFLNKLETAETQIKRYVNTDSVLENLFF